MCKLQQSTLTTNRVHCLSVFSGDLGSPLLFSLTKNLSLYMREERQRTRSQMNCEGGEQERSENKVSRMSSAAERRGRRGETPSKYQVRICRGERGRLGGRKEGRERMQGRAQTSPSHPTTRASNGKMKYSRRCVSATISLTQIERQREMSADAQGQRHSVATCCQREMRRDSAVQFKKQYIWSNEMVIFKLY